MKVLLNDSSVLLNLLAADCLAEVVAATGWQLAICPAVRQETRKLRDAATGELVMLDIAPLIECGLIQVLDLIGDEEKALYVEYSRVVDDGEAMSIAIAASRALDLAIDDKQATNHARRTFPSLKLWTTPEILKHWAEVGSVSTNKLAAAVRLIEVRARYFPHTSHPLAPWWNSVKGLSD